MNNSPGILFREPYFDEGTADADALAFISVTGLIKYFEKKAVDNLVKSLKGASLWAKFLAIYPFVGNSASQHKYNLKDPRDLDAAYRLSFTGSPKYSYKGCAFSGAENADTHIVADSVMSRLDKHLSVWLTPVVPIAASYFPMINSYVSHAQSDGFILWGDAAWTGYASDGITSSQPAVSLPDMLLVSRSDEANLTCFSGSNGIRTFAQAAAVGPPQNEASIFLGSDAVKKYYVGSYQLATLGASMTSAEITTFYSIVSQFQGDLGRF